MQTNMQYPQQYRNIEFARSSAPKNNNHLNVALDDKRMGDDPRFYGRGASTLYKNTVSYREIYQPVCERNTSTRRRIMTEKGIADPWGKILILVFAVILFSFFLQSAAGWVKARSEVDGLSRDVISAENTIASLTETLHYKEGRINVGYEAAQNGMVSAKSANVIYLTAPETAVPTWTQTAQGGEQLAMMMGD
ncbi:MAG: hypothetical protein Q4C54_09285 [Clostridia bacterium]|nr:hypothetical protein [Clostridia bacterium]